MAASSSKGFKTTATSSTTEKEPSAFLMRALPASTRSTLPDKNPPTTGTEPEMTYLTVRSEMPSYCEAAMPCTVRKSPKSPNESPMSQRRMLLKKSPSFSVLTSFERFPTNPKTRTATETGRTTAVNNFKIPPLKEAEQQPFTDVEIKKLWGRYAEGDRVVGCILLMIYTGMMPGELLQLKADMIDQERQEIVGAGLKTKKRKETPIVYPDIIGPVLEQLISTSASRAGYVLGMNKDNLYEEYYAALERADVRKLPPYSCRHTTATALALVNVAPSTIQEVMRHTKFSTTQRYIFQGFCLPC